MFNVEPREFIDKVYRFTQSTPVKKEGLPQNIHAAVEELMNHVNYGGCSRPDIIVPPRITTRSYESSYLSAAGPVCFVFSYDPSTAQMMAIDAIANDPVEITDTIEEMKRDLGLR